MDAGKQIAALREKLRYHNEKYYDHGRSRNIGL